MVFSLLIKYPLLESNVDLHVIGGLIHHNGQVLLCDGFARDIKQLDEDTLEVVGVEVDFLKGFCDDLAVNSNGDLAWTGFLSGTVRFREEATGTIRDLNTGGESPSQFPQFNISDLAGVNPITFDSQDNLWVKAFAPLAFTLDTSPANAAPSARPLSNPGLAGFNAFQFCPDGNLYAPVGAANAVVRAVPSPSPFNPVLTVEFVASVNHPVAVACASDGTLYSLDRISGEISTIDSVTGAVAHFADGPILADNLDLDEVGGHLYVSGNLNRLMKFSLADGSLIVESPEAPLIHASGMATFTDPVTGDSLVYVADSFQLHVLNPKKFWDPVVTTRVAEQQGGDFPGCFTVTVNDAHVACTTFRGFLAIMDRGTLDIVDTAGSAGEFSFTQAMDLQFLPDGDLIVANPVFGTIWRVHRDGGFGTSGVLTRTVFVDGLDFPMGLALNDAADTLYVTTYSVDPFLNPAGVDGTVIEIDMATLTQTVITTGLDRPQGIAILGNGDLVVGQSRPRTVDRIDISTGVVTNLDSATGDEVHQPSDLSTFAWPVHLEGSSFMGVVSLDGVFSYLPWFGNRVLYGENHSPGATSNDGGSSVNMIHMFY